ncbi:MAG: hypothetical protein QM760_08240 [Nibricoccus sp.]
MPASPLRANVLALIVTAVGCTQMAGYLIESRPLRGIGAASCVAPMPKVFSDVNGLETFASEFQLTWKDSSGKSVVLPLTPELYGQLGGPYNRRNVYGAALSYAPRMPEPLWTTVFCYAFKPDGLLRREFGVPADATELTVVIRTRTKNRNDVWTLSPACAQ